MLQRKQFIQTVESENPNPPDLSEDEIEEIVSSAQFYLITISAAVALVVILLVLQILVTCLQRQCRNRKELQIWKRLNQLYRHHKRMYKYPGGPLVDNLSVSQDSNENEQQQEAAEDTNGNGNIINGEEIIDEPHVAENSDERDTKLWFVHI